MNQLVWFVFIAMVVLLSTLAFVPYKECFVTTASDFPNMMESCLENIKDDTMYTTITKNEKYAKVAGALDKALTRDINNNVITYQENGTRMCVMNPSRFNVPQSCIFEGKNGAYYSLKPTGNSINPTGCLVNPNNNSFPMFLEDIEYLMNKQEYDTITNIVARADSARQRIKALDAQIAANNAAAEAVNKKNAALDIENKGLTTTLQIETNYNQKASEIRDGKTPGTAVINARELMDRSVTTNGVRWVLCNGQPRKTYCLMDPNYHGGGWMLLAKMAEGSTFHFDSNLWEDMEEMAPDALSLDGQLGDAKFPAFNHVKVKDIMVIFLIDMYGGHLPESKQTTPGARGWVWIIEDWWPADKVNGITAREGFSKTNARNAPVSNPMVFDPEGIEKKIWSHQKPEMRIVIGGHSHLQTSTIYGTNAWGSVRLGIASNENGPGDFLSNDTWCGLGGGVTNSGCSTNPSMMQCFSAGDFYSCCGEPGQRRRFKALLFGR